MNFRYRKLSYVALNVTDPDRSVAFMRDIMGLEAVQSPASDVRFVRCDSHHHSTGLYAASVPGLRRIAFEMESREHLDAAQAHVRSLGIKTYAVSKEERDLLGLGEAFRFAEPASGLTIELLADPQPAAPFHPTSTRIARLGHVVIGVKQYRDTIGFFRDQLNFRISDEVDGMITFMRCFSNPFHHSLGVSAAPENRLHHVNFMVSDIDDIGRALYQLKRKGIPIVYGPGRHPPSGSVFLYFLDPDGSTMEFSYGMEEFPEEHAREPRLLPGSVESFDFWAGDPPDPRFGAGGRFATAPA